MSLDATYSENDRASTDLDPSFHSSSDTLSKRLTSKHRNALIDIEIINEQRALRALLNDELYSPIDES